MTGIYGLMIEFNPVLGPHNRTVQYPEPTTHAFIVLGWGELFPAIFIRAISPFMVSSTNSLAGN